MQAKGLPAQLQTLGPLECYELMLELMAYLKKVAKDPSLLLEDADYSQMFSSELFQHWWLYNRLIHSRGGGKTANDEKTDVSYWESTRQHLLEYAEDYVRLPLFKKITKIFCDSFCDSIRLKPTKPSQTGDNVHDYGWFDMLESADPQDVADVASFRKISKFIKPYSTNESFFGQVRVCVCMCERVCLFCTFTFAFGVAVFLV